MCKSYSGYGFCKIYAIVGANRLDFFWKACLFCSEWVLQWYFLLWSVWFRRRRSLSFIPNFSSYLIYYRNYKLPYKVRSPIFFWFESSLIPFIKIFHLRSVHLEENKCIIIEVGDTPIHLSIKDNWKHLTLSVQISLVKWKKKKRKER